MKNYKVLVLLLATALFTLPIFAQSNAKKSTKKVAKETAEAVSKMDESQQKMILNYTRNMVKTDVKKEMTKAMKKMSAEDQQKVLDYIAQVNKIKNTKAEKPVRQRPAAKTKPTKPAKSADKPAKPEKLTEIEILDKTFDFGTIPQGEKAAYTYKIKNVGDNDLVISHAKGSCGCTVPSWPKTPIPPGEIANIKVVFNSRGKKGKQHKRITITANTDPAQNFMSITGNVEVPEPVKQ